MPSPPIRRSGNHRQAVRNRLSALPRPAAVGLAPISTLRTSRQPDGEPLPNRSDKGEAGALKITDYLETEARQLDSCWSGWWRMLQADTQQRPPDGGFEGEGQRRNVHGATVDGQARKKT
ncbi:GM26689 [Drosophila sechellia]|uniref:GM26689 n=1 Tax=Drosophila sechellia TaxID=7238 RepID=B4IP72_DROSE|nr:GM26689 [Drosophila sechellia]